MKLRSSQKPSSDEWDRLPRRLKKFRRKSTLPSAVRAPLVIFQIPIRRPQGAKESVLKEVFVFASGIPGRKITKRMVKKCWDEYRSFQTEIRLELS